jgi:ABC-type dipeptide/oligopeptide/nickel transport system permease subunit
MTMAYLMLYGNGWTQRWGIAPGMENQVRSQVSQVGTDTTGQLVVVDPVTGAEATLVVAWGLVAAAVVLGGAADVGDDDSVGQYA